MNTLHENPKKKSKEKSRQKSINREILIITYLMIVLFVGLTGSFIYFIGVDSKEVVNNSYNKRQELLAETVVRGKIFSKDREILAETLTDDDGEEYRYYPYNNVFCHVVGRNSHGKTGIELSQNISLLTSNENILVSAFQQLKGEKNIGDNVITTLDVDLQQAAYDALGDRKGAVVVLEAETGKILTMVSKSDYNPNKVDENWESLSADTDSVLMNRATQFTYPPGSTFKMLTALEYMREFDNYEDYLYNCDGSEIFSGVKINCYQNNEHGEEDIAKSFAKSCNTSFANMGMELNAGSFRKLCEKFLFNKELPVDFAHATSSFALSKSSDESEMPQTAIGQGDTLASPLHMAMITQTIANNGTMMIPYVVDSIEAANGNTVTKYDPVSHGRIITRKEAKALRKLMSAVVEEGTGSGLSGRGYTAAGKTGSAEYNSEKDSHAWFVGYAPAKNPEIAICVIVEDGGTGSGTAVPVAAKVLDTYFE